MTKKGYAGKGSCDSGDCHSIPKMKWYSVQRAELDFICIWSNILNTQHVLNEAYFLMNLSRLGGCCLRELWYQAVILGLPEIKSSSTLMKTIDKLVCTKYNTQVREKTYQYFNFTFVKS